MKRFIAAVLLALTTACGSVPISDTGDSVAFRIQNDNFSDAVIYVSPCDNPTQCQQRLGTVTGNSEHTFRLHPRQTTPTRYLYVTFHLIGAPTSVLVEPVAVSFPNEGSDDTVTNVRLVIGATTNFTFLIIERPV